MNSTLLRVAITLYCLVFNQVLEYFELSLTPFAPFYLTLCLSFDEESLCIAQVCFTCKV